MKTLIVYFSLDGNTKWIAEKLHQKLPNTTLHAIELADKPINNKLWRTIVYGFKVTFYKDIAIKSSNLDMADYDQVIIGAPVWMGQVPPPMKAFLKTYPLNGRKVAAFCSMSGELSRFFDHLENLSGVDELMATLAILEPLQNMTEKNLEKIDGFIEKINQITTEKNETIKNMV